jgi:deoxyribose-phosphate aldolase
MRGQSPIAAAGQSGFSRDFGAGRASYTRRMAEVLARPPSVAAHFPRLGSVDAVGLEAQADELASLVVEGAARRRALEVAVAAFELPALRRTETPGSARAVCATAAAAAVAAVRVHPRFVDLCRDCLRGSGVLATVPVTAADAGHAAGLGADGVVLDMDGCAFLCGRHGSVVDEIAWVKSAIGDAELTVTLPTGELGGYDNVRHAALLAMIGGADLVEDASSSPATALCILEAIRDVHHQTGRAVGLEANVDGVEAALRHLVLVHETVGVDWLVPGRCRIGGSPALLDELLDERAAGS